MATATADWLAHYSPPEPTWLSHEAERSARIELAFDLAALMNKISRRKRCTGPFTTVMDRKLAQFLAAQWEFVVLTRARPEAEVWMTMRACWDATNKRAGRPRLSLDMLEDQEAENTHRGSADDGGRHKRRVTREAKFERAVRDWHSAGNSILGSPDTFPKK